MPCSFRCRRSSCELCSQSCNNFSIRMGRIANVSHRWNQLTIQESTERILPNLDELYGEIRRMALDLHLRIQNLQNAVTNTNNEDHIDAVRNLRACVHTAATIVSSASTILTAD